MDKEEKRVANLIQQINTIKNEKDSKLKAKNMEKRAEYMKKKAAVEKVDVVKKRERAKAFHKEEGQKRAREEAASSGSSYSKKSRGGDD
jgi:ribosome biogenesis protein BMS1